MADNLVLDSLKIGLVFTQFQPGFKYAAQQQDILFLVTSLSSIIEEFVHLIQNLAFRYDGLILYAPPEFTRADYQKVKQALPEEYLVIFNYSFATPFWIKS